MKDRGGKPYLRGIDLRGLEKVPSFTHIISPSRQAKKALGLSGRQYTKFRKSYRKLVRETQSLQGLVNPNMGEEHGTDAEVSAMPEQALPSAAGAATDSARPEDGAPEAGGERGAEATQG